jgi:hypothetical protein
VPNKHDRLICAMVKPFMANNYAVIGGKLADEGMTDGPPTFAYLVFGPGRGCCERLSRPVKAVAQRGPGAILGAQARIRGVQVRLGLG